MATLLYGKAERDGAFSLEKRKLRRIKWYKYLKEECKEDTFYT